MKLLVLFSALYLSSTYASITAPECLEEIKQFTGINTTQTLQFDNWVTIDGDSCQVKAKYASTTMNSGNDMKIFSVEISDTNGTQLFTIHHNKSSVIKQTIRVCESGKEANTSLVERLSVMVKKEDALKNISREVLYIFRMSSSGQVLGAASIYNDPSAMRTCVHPGRLNLMNTALSKLNLINDTRFSNPPSN